MVDSLGDEIQTSNGFGGELMQRLFVEVSFGGLGEIVEVVSAESALDLGGLNGEACWFGRVRFQSFR